MLHFVDILGFILWGFAQLLESVVLCHQIQEVTSHYFFKYFFSSVCMLPHCMQSPFFLGLWEQNVISFIINPQVPEALFIFFQSFFFLLFRLDTFYLSILSVIVSSQICYLTHPVHLSFPPPYFLFLKFPFSSPLYILFLCWNFLFFYLFQKHLLLLVRVFV